MPITDLLSQATSSTSGRPVVASLSAPGHSIGGTTITVNAATNWPTTTVIYFSIYGTTTVGSLTVKDATTQTDWKGTLSGTTISNMVLTGGTDRDYPAGVVVELTPTAREWKDLHAWATTEHDILGVHSLTSSSSITSAKFITSLNDTNGNELFKVTPTTSAVNEITVANAATGNAPSLSATGGDTNINLILNGKGTGGVLTKNPYKFFVYRNASSAINGGATTKLQFDTELFDTGSNYDNATNFRFVAPIAGFYRFSAGMTIATGGVETYSIALYKNGTELVRGQNLQSAGTATVTCLVPSIVVSLAANDYVEIFGGNGSGGTKALSVGAAPIATYFGGEIISTT